MSREEIEKRLEQWHGQTQRGRADFDSYTLALIDAFADDVTSLLAEVDRLEGEKEQLIAELRSVTDELVKFGPNIPEVASARGLLAQHVTAYLTYESPLFLLDGPEGGAS